MRTPLIALLLTNLFIGLPSYAGESDFSAPIEIEAEQVEVNAQDGTSTYQGDVYLSRGTMKIRADKVVLKQLNDEISAEIFGTKDKPAEFSQQGDTGETMNAKAERIRYFSDQDAVEFDGNAEIKRAADTVKSDHIRYDLRAEKILAGAVDGASKTQTDGNRVRIVIQPPAKDSGSK